MKLELTLLSSLRWRSNTKNIKRLYGHFSSVSCPVDSHNEIHDICRAVETCLCQNNLKKNPSRLVPESMTVMMEMRTYNIIPNSISYNVSLSCLGRARMVKELCHVLDSMTKSGCDPNWCSYYLVVRALYLSGRFGKGNVMVEEMIARGLVPERKFFNALVGVLCGVERANHTLNLFKRIKRSLVGGYGPVYEILIPKLGMGIALSCSRELLNPQITKVFKLMRKIEVVNISVWLAVKPQPQIELN